MIVFIMKDIKDIKSFITSNKLQFLLLIFIILVVFFLVFISVTKNKKEISNHNSIQSTESKSESNLPSKSSETKSESDNITLIKDKQKILSISKNLVFPVIWRDYIFYQKSEDNGYTGHLMSYNFVTEKYNTLYSNTKNRNIGDIDVIYDTLYFSVHGFVSVEPSFYIDLTSSDLKPIKYSEGVFQQLDKYGDKYLISQGFGDGGHSFATYSLLDTISKKINKIADFSYSEDSEDNTSYLGVDARNRLIFESFFPLINEELNPKIKSIYSVSMDNNHNKKTLFNFNITDNYIYSIMSSDSNSLILMGDNLTILDLSTDKVSKKVSLSENIREYHISHADSKDICFKGSVTDSPKMVFNINSDVSPVNDSSNKCGLLLGNKLDKKISKYVLPSGYKFVLE